MSRLLNFLKALPLVTAGLFLIACSPALTVEPLSWSGADGVEIRGALHRPEGDRRFPTIVFVGGSGRGPALETKIARAHVKEMTQRGYAVATYDKRGTGDSGGEFRDWTFDELASDLVRGLNVVAEHPNVDPNRIGVVAISQGWWVSLAAVRDTSVPRYLVGIGAPTVSPAEQDEYVVFQSLKSAGATPEQIDDLRPLLRDWNAVVRGQLDRTTYGQRVRDMRARYGEKLVDGRFEAPSPDSTFATWYVGVMDHDPMPDLQSLTLPAAVFLGANDAVVDPERSRGDYERLNAAGADITVTVAPDASHDLSRRRFGFRTWSRSYWEALDNWARATQDRPVHSTE